MQTRSINRCELFLYILQKFAFDLVLCTRQVQLSFYQFIGMMEKNDARDLMWQKLAYIMRFAY